MITVSSFAGLCHIKAATNAPTGKEMRQFVKVYSNKNNPSRYGKVSPDQYELLTTNPPISKAPKLSALILWIIVFLGFPPPKMPQNMKRYRPINIPVLARPNSNPNTFSHTSGRSTTKIMKNPPMISMMTFKILFSVNFWKTDLTFSFCARQAFKIPNK